MKKVLVLLFCLSFLLIACGASDTSLKGQIYIETPGEPVLVSDGVLTDVSSQLPYGQLQILCEKNADNTVHTTPFWYWSEKVEIPDVGSTQVTVSGNPGGSKKDVMVVLSGKSIYEGEYDSLTNVFSDVSERNQNILNSVTNTGIGEKIDNIKTLWGPLSSAYQCKIVE